MGNTYRYRSFFWPAVLILAGLIALLVNTGQVSVERVGALVSLWPVILIVLGLELVLRRTLHGVAGDVAAALVVVIAVVGSAAYVVVAPNPSSVHSYDVAGQLGSVGAATLEINVGAATVDLRGDAEANDLYSAHIEYTGQRPRVSFDQDSKTLSIDQTDSGFNFFQNRKFALTLRLNPGVKWAITSNSGAASLTMDLAHIPLASLEINTGASKDDVTLGTAAGIVPIDVNGGALTVHVHRPRGVAAAVEVSGGAVSLQADGHSFHAIGDVSYGSVDTDGYKISVNGGACTVTLDTSTTSG